MLWSRLMLRLEIAPWENDFLCLASACRKWWLTRMRHEDLDEMAPRLLMSGGEKVLFGCWLRLNETRRLLSEGNREDSC